MRVDLPDPGEPDRPSLKNYKSIMDKNILKEGVCIITQESPLSSALNNSHISVDWYYIGHCIDRSTITIVYQSYHT